MRNKTIVQVNARALVAVALIGFCSQANAQALCPEMTRLRSDAQEALRQTRAVPASERCYRYNRLSEAWAEVAHYANDNREACHISIARLSDFERYHSEAVRDRDNACAGRPLRPYGADIIQH